MYLHLAIPNVNAFAIHNTMLLQRHALVVVSLLACVCNVPPDFRYACVDYEPNGSEAVVNTAATQRFAYFGFPTARFGSGLTQFGNRSPLWWLKAVLA